MLQKLLERAQKRSSTSAASLPPELLAGLSSQSGDRASGLTEFVRLSTVPGEDLGSAASLGIVTEMGTRQGSVARVDAFLDSLQGVSSNLREAFPTTESRMQMTVEKTTTRQAAPLKVTLPSVSEVNLEQAIVGAYQFATPTTKQKEGGEGGGTPFILAIQVPLAPRGREGKGASWFGEERHPFANILTGKTEEFSLKPGGKYLSTGVDAGALNSAKMIYGRKGSPKSSVPERSTKGTAPKGGAGDLFKGVKGASATGTKASGLEWSLPNEKRRRRR